MIAKFKQGMGFAGLLNYANDKIMKEGTKIIDSKDVCLSSNEMMATSFRLQAQASKTKKPVGHLILSFHPDDESRFKIFGLADICRSYMKEMGIDNTQYVMFQHSDTKHPHVHIVYNRVNNDGKLIKGDTNYNKSVAVTKTITSYFGLKKANEKRNVNVEKLKGKDITKYKILKLAERSLRLNSSWKSFIEDMKKGGVQVRFSRDFGGKINGIVFTSGTISYSGFKVDRSLSYNKLAYHMGEFEGLEVENSMKNHKENTEKTPVLSSKVDKEEREFSQDSSYSSPTFEGNSNAETTSNEGSGSQSAGLGQAVMEIAFQPHIVPSSGGGGGSSTSKSDDDKDKNKRKFRRR